MSIKVAINGFGRIGRCTLRAIYEQSLQNEFEVVAIRLVGSETIGAFKNDSFVIAFLRRAFGL